MALRKPTEFVGLPTLPESKIKIMTHWYETAVAAEREATETEMNAFYEGWRRCAEVYMRLIFDMPLDDWEAERQLENADQQDSQ